LDRFKRFGLIAAVAALALLVPTRAASQTEPPVIEVVVSLTDLAAPIVNVSVPEMTPIVNIEVPEQPAPVVNVPAGAPPTIVVEPSSTPAPQVVYKDRTVEVDRIVEVPSCLDYGDLPYFDLANALTRAFPGTLWSLNGSHYNGLTWLDDSPQPDMTAIIGGWLAHLAQDC
jgi:hypothetical protein